MKKLLEAFALMILIILIVLGYFYYPLVLGGIIVGLTFLGICYVIVTNGGQDT